MSTGTPIAGDRVAGADRAQGVTARPDEDPGRHPRQRGRDRAGQRQPRQAECLADHPARVGRCRDADHGGDARIRRGRQDGAGPAHRVPQDAAHGHLGPGQQRGEGGRRVGSVLAGAERQDLGRVGPVAPDVEGQAVEAGRVQEDGVWQGPIAGRVPAVDEDDAGAGRAAPGRDEPGGQVAGVGWDHGVLGRQAEVGRREPRRPSMGEARPDPIDVGEPQGGHERGGGQPGDDAGATEGGHQPRGRHPERPVKRAPLDLVR